MNPIQSSSLNPAAFQRELQRELEFSIPEPADLDDQAALASLLKRHPEGLKRADLARRLGWSERKVRHIASACDLVISAPGQPGFRHLDNCQLEEVVESVARRRHTAREIEDKCARTLRIARRRLAGRRS